MKEVIGIIVMIIGFFSFTMANTPQQDEGLPSHEEELTIELDTKELPITTTKEQRELRCEKKQMIKAQILALYKDIKDEKTKDLKKETKHEITELKKELRTLNTKIAYSYKQQFKRFF